MDMDSYQPIYDAVRSRLGSCDVERAIRDATHLDGSHAIALIQEAFICAAYDQSRPSVLYRPKIAIDGPLWCALYGDNLQEGVAGFGESPAAAMLDFDRAWNEKLADARARATGT